ECLVKRVKAVVVAATPYLPRVKQGGPVEAFKDTFPHSLQLVNHHDRTDILPIAASGDVSARFEDARDFLVFNFVGFEVSDRAAKFDEIEQRFGRDIECFALVFHHGI
ncbi:MAG: hypothetical protein RR213_06310, partial [Raoultibacter sp.]